MYRLASFNNQGSAEHKTGKLHFPRPNISIFDENVGKFQRKSLLLLY